MNKVKQRLTYISNARVIGILLVVFGHSYPFNVQIPDILYLFRSFIYCFHMPLFIFLSGFLVSKTKSIEYRGISEYLKNRTVKLLTPYIVLSLLCYVPKVLVSAYINDTVELSLANFVRTILVPRENVWGHFWFLPVIWIFAIVSILYEKLLKDKNVFAILILPVSFLMLFLPQTTQWFAINDLTKNLCWYFLGMWLGKSDKSITYIITDKIGGGGYSFVSRYFCFS